MLVARCSYHPDVETELTCTECGIPICPKEMILTPVGYKCPEHARAAPGQFRLVKPRQFALALAAGLAVGIGGAFLVTLVRMGFFMGIIWGALAAEAVRRASGGHRGTTVGAIAAGSIAAGTLLVGVSWLTAIVAIVVALVQLAVIGKR